MDYVYVIPRRSESVTEWTEAAQLRLLNGRELVVAWFEGNPADLDLVPAE